MQTARRLGGWSRHLLGGHNFTLLRKRTRIANGCQGGAEIVEDMKPASSRVNQYRLAKSSPCLGLSHPELAQHSFRTKSSLTEACATGMATLQQVRVRSFGTSTAAAPQPALRERILASPGDSSASLAESHACGLALLLLTSLARGHWDTHGSTLRARLVGDCIPVVRYTSAQARFRSANQRAHIDHGLGLVSEIGWNLEWQVVNRRHNSHAHALARIAAIWANDFCLHGSRVSRSVIEWRGLRHTRDNEVVLPAWP